YDDVINNIWDYNDKKKLDDTFIIGYLARVYTPFLVVMEQGNIYQTTRTIRKRFAVAAKIKVSNDTTVIVCPTRTINFFATIVKKTNLIDFFEMTRPIGTDISAEEALARLRSNIAGFIIKHRDDSVEVTYINAVSNDTTVIVCPTRTINFFATIVKKTNLIDFFEMTRPIGTDISAEEALARL
ncbi:hypothetical protein PCHCB_000517000, partial [Plasmodium chabaudi chabaudi]